MRIQWVRVALGGFSSCFSGRQTRESRLQGLIPLKTRIHLNSDPRPQEANHCGPCFTRISSALHLGHQLVSSRAPRGWSRWAPHLDLDLVVPAARAPRRGPGDLELQVVGQSALEQVAQPLPPHRVHLPRQSHRCSAARKPRESAESKCHPLTDSIKHNTLGNAFEYKFAFPHALERNS